MIAAQPCAQCQWRWSGDRCTAHIRTSSSAWRLEYMHAQPCMAWPACCADVRANLTSPYVVKCLRGCVFSSWWVAGRGSRGGGGGGPCLEGHRCGMPTLHTLRHRPRRSKALACRRLRVGTLSSAAIHPPRKRRARAWVCSHDHACMSMCVHVQAHGTGTRACMCLHSGPPLALALALGPRRVQAAVCACRYARMHTCTDMPIVGALKLPGTYVGRCRHSLFAARPLI